MNYVNGSQTPRPFDNKQIDSVVDNFGVFQACLDLGINRRFKRRESCRDQVDLLTSQIKSLTSINKMKCTRKAKYEREQKSISK